MTAQLALDLAAAPTIRILVHDRITAVLAAFDAHDPGIRDDGTYQCRCEWHGAEAEWNTHLADALSDALTVQTVELPA
jgi:hypothetical protein